MKKWIITLVVILVVCAYFVWPRAHLEEPIVMSVQFDEAAKTLAVSYIVEKTDNTYVMEIAYNTKGFYPPRTNGNWENSLTFSLTGHINLARTMSYCLKSLRQGIRHLHGTFH